MKWVEALKVFNQGKPMWCVARKGTPEYDEVKRIMNSSKPEAVAKRNEERGEKVKEQLKEVASASEKRREEAKKKYAEKLTELSMQSRRMRVGLKSEIMTMVANKDNGNKVTEFQSVVDKIIVPQGSKEKENVEVTIFERPRGTTEWKKYMTGSCYITGRNNGRSYWETWRVRSFAEHLDSKERFASHMSFIEDRYAYENAERKSKATSQLTDLKIKSRKQISKKRFIDRNPKLMTDPFLLKILGEPEEDNQSSWEHLIGEIEKVKEGEEYELDHNDFAFPTDEDLTGKKVYVIFSYLQKVKFKDVPPKSRKLVPGYDMRLIYDTNEEGKSTKSLVLIH